MKTIRYANLDLLRLFLAIEVLWRHTSGSGGGQHGPWILNAVPTFVMLSGLLIPGSFEGSRGWGHFAWKRLLRVGPAMVVSLLAIAFLFGLVPMERSLIPYITAGLIMVGYNAALWSLMVEEILYASHAVLRIGKIWKAETIAVLIVLCVAGSFLPVRSEVMRLFQCAAAYSIGNLAYLNIAKVNSWKWQWLTLGAVVSIGAFLLTHTTPVMLTGSIFTILALRNMPQVPLPEKWPDLSYGIYIYHEPILIALKMKAGMVGNPLIVYTMGIAFVVACLSWFLLESQALKFKNQPWRLTLRRPNNPDLAEVATA